MKEFKKVRVYFNLHKKCFSVMDYSTRLVIGHTNSIVLENVEFKVNESGRQRVIKEKRKNVHAFVIGNISEGVFGEVFNKRIIYNPYNSDSFLRCEENSFIPINKARKVSLQVEENKGRIYALD